MKKLVLLGAIALTSLMGAQTKFGVNAGLLSVFGKIKTPSGKSSGSETGFYAGAFAEFGVSNKFKVQPAVNVGVIDGGTAIQIPVMGKFYLDDKFNLQAGPHILIDTAEKMSGVSSTAFGLAFGAGYDINEKFLLEARYNAGLNNLIENAPSGYSAKIHTINVGLGYRF